MPKSPNGHQRSVVRQIQRMVWATYPGLRPAQRTCPGCYRAFVTPPKELCERCELKASKFTGASDG